MIVTIFNILNVAVLLIVLTYVFRTRLRTLLVAAIDLMRLAHKRLQNDIAQAEQSHVELERALQNQHDFARDAHQKLETWRAFEQAKEVEQRAEHDVQATRLMAKQVHQAAHVQQYRAQMTLLPAAFEQATQQLEKKYRDPQAGASYLETITKELP
jgi:hypothetical protein